MYGHRAPVDAWHRGVRPSQARATLRRRNCARCYPQADRQRCRNTAVEEAGHGVQAYALRRFFFATFILRWSRRRSVYSSPQHYHATERGRRRKRLTLNGMNTDGR